MTNLAEAKTAEELMRTALFRIMREGTDLSLPNRAVMSSAAKIADAALVAAGLAVTQHQSGDRHGR